VLERQDELNEVVDLLLVELVGGDAVFDVS
jgi:hypothetical protein